MSAVAVALYLAERGIPFAVIGARAMVLRGIVRSSVDTDFLTTDRTVLDDAFWANLENATVSVRRGDFDDPLAGVVGVVFRHDFIDIVVGRYKWQQSIVARAEPLVFGSSRLPVARKADLVLLKLFAGGQIDLWDIGALLKSDPSLAADVDLHINDLPADARDLWRRLHP